MLKAMFGCGWSQFDDIIRDAKFSVNTVALKQTGHNARVWEKKKHA